MNLKVAIDELVLEGIVAGQEQEVLAALAAALGRRFAGGVPNVRGGLLTLPPLTLAPGAGPAAAGKQIADAIYGAVTDG